MQIAHSHFRGTGALVTIEDGTSYELEIDSTVRWAINVTDMPSPRFRSLLAMLETPAVALITRMEVGSFQMQLRFSFHLNVRHCHASHEADCAYDERLRCNLSHVLGIRLEFAEEQVRV